MLTNHQLNLYGSHLRVLPNIAHRRVLDIWPALSLARQFVLASTAVLIVCTIVLGAWVADEIEDAK